MKTIYQLPGLRRVPGAPGQIGEVAVLKYGIEHDEYITHIGLPGHWPSSMQLSVSFSRVKMLDHCAHGMVVSSVRRVNNEVVLKGLVVGYRCFARR